MVHGFTWFSSTVWHWTSCCSEWYKFHHLLSANDHKVIMQTITRPGCPYTGKSTGRSLTLLSQSEAHPMEFRALPSQIYVLCCQKTKLSLGVCQACFEVLVIYETAQEPAAYCCWIFEILKKDDFFSCQFIVRQVAKDNNFLTSVIQTLRMILM